MIMAFDFRVNFLRLQLGGGQACTLVRDLKLFSVISRSETAMVREWSVDQRKFLLKRKLQGATLAVIQQEYAYWWPSNTWYITNAPAPTSRFLRKFGIFSCPGKTLFCGMPGGTENMAFGRCLILTYP